MGFFLPTPSSLSYCYYYVFGGSYPYLHGDGKFNSTYYIEQLIPTYCEHITVQSRLSEFHLEPRERYHVTGFIPPRGCINYLL